MSDHDLLIQLNQKMTDMCKSMDKEFKTNSDAHQDILDKIEKQRDCINGQSKRFISSKLFYWLVGFIILGLMSIGAVTADVSNKIGKVEAQIEFITNGCNE